MGRKARRKRELRRSERRQAAKGSRRGSRPWLVPALAAGLVVAGAAVWWLSAGSADDPLAERVQSFPQPASVAHIRPGERAKYSSDPPTAGPHYGSVHPTGFFDRPAPDELLVHNLEHGQVVVYYDPERATREALDDLKGLAARYTGQWDGVVILPRDGMAEPYILTAWRKMMRLNQYDPGLVRAFLDAYRGRGPENRVR